MLTIRTEIIKTIIDPRNGKLILAITQKWLLRQDSVTEMQVSDSDTSRDIEDNDSIE